MKVFFVKNKKLGLYLSYKGNMVSTKLCGIRFNNRADATTYANATNAAFRVHKIPAKFSVVQEDV